MVVFVACALLLVYVEGIEVEVERGKKILIYSELCFFAPQVHLDFANFQTRQQYVNFGCGGCGGSV